MATDQNNTQGRGAAHFSSSTQGSGTGSRPRRTATKREATSRSGRTSASRSASSLSTGAQGVKPASHMSERTARATQRAAAAHKRRAQGTHPSNMRKKSTFPAAALIAVVVVGMVAAVGFLVVPHLFQRTSEPVVDDYPSGENVIVTVPDGAGGSQIQQLLIESHVISDETTFYQEIQKQNADATMKSGTYQFITGATPSEVVRQLVAGPNATEYQLKLAEGLTVSQTAAKVESQLGISADDFKEQAKASNYVDEYPFLEHLIPIHKEKNNQLNYISIN